MVWGIANAWKDLVTLGTAARNAQINFVCRQGKGFVPNGFWRFDKSSYNLFKCLDALHCLGVKAPQGYIDIPYGMENIDHNESCADGHSGVLCGQCIQQLLPRYLRQML